MDGDRTNAPDGSGTRLADADAPPDPPGVENGQGAAPGPAVDVRGVAKRFDGVTALEDVTLSVPAGSTTGLLGSNGAGKTTLFRLLVGHLEPDAGTVEVLGRPVAGTDPAVRHAVGYLPERAGFPEAMTGREVLSHHARLRGLPSGERDERVQAVLERVALAEAADRETGGYSKGMGRRLGLAAALLGEPRLLLLDEPTAGLDPLGVARLREVLGDLQAAGLTMLVSSHVLGEVEALSDRVAVLHRGQVLVEDDVDDLRDAAGDGSRVEVRLEDAGGVVTVESVANEHGATVLEARDRRVDLDCPREAVPDLLAALEARAPVASYEVRRPGLEGLVREQIGGGARAG